MAGEEVVFVVQVSAANNVFGLKRIDCINLNFFLKVLDDLHLVYLALAGYDAETAADVLPAVLDLAAAGGMDLAYASDLATDAMSALGIEASKENLTQFGDQMAMTASKANTSVSYILCRVSFCSDFTHNDMNHSCPSDCPTDDPTDCPKDG